MTKQQLQQKFQDIMQKIDDTAPYLSGFCISAMEHCVKVYTAEDWADYAKETGNSPLNKLSIPKNGIEKAIDDATGFAEQQHCDILKFAIWFAEGFLKGFLNGDDD